MKDVCNTNAINIPIHNGSNPRVNRAGPINGITMNVISIKSNIKPSKNINNNTIMSVKILSSGNSIKNLWMKSSPPKPLKTKENRVAPIRIIKTILVSLIES